MNEMLNLAFKSCELNNLVQTEYNREENNDTHNMECTYFLMSRCACFW